MARVTSFKFHLIFMQFLPRREVLGRLFKVEQGVCPQHRILIALPAVLIWILLKSALYYKELY